MTTRHIARMAAAILLAVSTAQADVIHVDAANCLGPGDGSVGDPYCSIQTAIDNAVDTDEIVVAPGTYFQPINFLGKAITLRSSDGPEVTTIDAIGFLFDSVLVIVSGEGSDTVLDGFTVTGGNQIGLDASAMRIVNSSPTVINCTFSGNHSTPMFNTNGGSPTVINCTFSDNQGLSGGMFNVLFSSPTVINCTFSGNMGFGGGMINTTDCSPTVINCTFSGNTGICGGGMLNCDNSNPTVINCTFSGNTAESGGAMQIEQGSSPTVINCTFGGNTAPFGNALGFDFVPRPSAITMTNCILRDGGDEIWNNDGSTVTINYTNVQGGFPGIGNIDADPLFVDPDNGDLRLQPGSPCIDAGDNAAVPKFVLRDLDGNPRFVADVCAGADGATVDMGAYEFQGTSCDLGTMLAMFAAWGRCNDCGDCQADLDGDCSVGILDLLILLANWGPCP